MVAGAHAVLAERKIQNFALPRLLFATWRACAAAMPWCSRMRGHCGVAGAFLFAFWVHLMGSAARLCAAGLILTNAQVLNCTHYAAILGLLGGGWGFERGSTVTT